MRTRNRMQGRLSSGSASRLAAVAVVALGVGGRASDAKAIAPCGDFGECKTLIEINASDGDIGFHFLVDGDDLSSAELRDPNNKKIFSDKAKKALGEQTMTETFVESAEPLCWPDPEADPDDEIVTLEEFLDRWIAGTYVFHGKSDGEKVEGESELTYSLPAAPQDVEFDGSVLSWSAGDDLGNCATAAELDVLVADGVLPEHPEDVDVVMWEVVMETDVDDGDPQQGLKYTIRVPGDIFPMEVAVPQEYLDSLDANTPLKAEVGAIGVDDNATFSEEDEFCNTPDGTCP